MPDGQPTFRLTHHARLVIERRGIESAWIARTLDSPAAIEPDKLDPIVEHALLAIPEFGGRVLRVVYNPSEHPPLVITAYFDRARKGTI